MTYGPDHTSFEITSRCNAKCSFCIRPHINRPVEQLPLPLFKKAIDELPQDRGIWITPSAWDEPFVTPHIWGYISYLDGKNFKLLIYTNGSCLDNDDIEKLTTQSNIEQIYVSFNGGTREEYENTMVGLEFNRTLDNVGSLLKKKRKGQQVNISCCLVDSNRNGAGGVRELFPSADNILIYEHFDVRGLVDNKNANPNPDNLGCPRTFFYLAVNADGNIIPCCQDFQSEVVWGNIRDDNIMDIWAGEKANEFRRKILRGEITSIPLCERCDEPLRSQPMMRTLREIWGPILDL